MSRFQLSFALIVSTACLHFFTINSHAQTTRLKSKDRIERSLNANESHEYSLSLKKGHFYYIELVQDGVDAIITAFDPDGEKIADFDSPNGYYGPEPIILTTDRTGSYRLMVKALNTMDKAGKYTLQILSDKRKPTTPEEQVDQLFIPWDKPESPGASIAVVRNGKVIYSKGYGYANLEYDIPNSPTTIFHIASVSKQFTAFAIATLADQGKVDLDADIRIYLPEVPDFGEKITLRQLGHHISGLRDQWNLLAMAGWRLDDVITKEHVLKLVSRQKDLNFKPGAEYLYCNTGFTLMAEVVSRVTGQSFAEWTQANIFQPLGMTNTLFYDDHEKIVKNRAYSYGEGQGTFEKRVLSYANVGATSLFTTVEDLAKWAINFDKMTVGNAAIMKQMHEQGILNNGEKISYAYGQVIGEYKGLKMVSHGGADAGYRTYLARFPEQGLSVIVFSNLGTFNPGSLAFQIVDIYLKDQIKEPVTDAPASPVAAASEKPSVEVSEAQLESYTGRYEIGPNFILTITREGKELYAQATGQPRLKIQPVAENEFFSPDANATVVFEKNSEGMVHQSILKQGGREITMPRLTDFDPAKVNLSAYTGNFYSPELETTYHFIVEKGKLIARHQRHPDIELTPTKKDNFSGNTWFFGQVAFTTDESQAINGCLVSGGRVRDLRFKKVE
ncbi:MAG: serine hydrolase [Lewinella sp.]|nr:serine hydrolase [Lewinella sp.]